MKFLKSLELKVWLSDKNNKILLGAIAAMALVVICYSFFGTPTSIPNQQETLSADTVIPEGFVLVPIEISNASTIGSLMGSYGIVDLFTARISSRTGSGKRIAHNVRLIRAPLNNEQYAVLTPEAQAGVLLQEQGPFFAVLQNPDQNKKSLFKGQETTTTKIEYFTEK